MKKTFPKYANQKKVSVVVTVLNEEKTIDSLLEALLSQTYSADEVVVTDGGSSDQTVKKIKAFTAAHPDLHLRVFQQKGNRSVGRNVAIQQTKNQLIAITDAGCVPHHDWLQELMKLALQQEGKEFVVAGYYEGKPATALQAAMVPYVLVMPEKLDAKHFLPATRSMLLTKTIWETLGRFNPKLSDNEDYAFAQKMLEQKIVILFAAKAIVSWIPRGNLRQFYWMIFRFARGDVYAGILRPKVLLVFGRYFLAILFGLWAVMAQQLLLYSEVVGCSFALYCSWAVLKNKRYVPKGWYWLPVLQFLADFGVMLGSGEGMLKRALSSDRVVSTDSKV